MITGLGTVLVNNLLKHCSWHMYHIVHLWNYTTIWKELLKIFQKPLDQNLQVGYLSDGNCRCEYDLDAL